MSQILLGRLMLTHNGMMTQQEQAGMGVLNIIKRSSPMLLANSHSFTEVLNLRAYDISPTKRQVGKSLI